MRYLATRGARVLARRPLAITESSARIEAPAEVAAGAAFEVRWRGPSNPGDQIVLVRASEPDGRYFSGEFSAAASGGSPVKLTAFSEPGAYEVRYLTKAGQVLARAALRLRAVGLRLEAPAKVEAGVEFDVVWSGPANKGDRIVIVPASAHEGSFITTPAFTQPAGASPVRLTTFSDPGAYEVRYLAGADGRSLARTPFRISESTARIEAPAAAAAGQEISVRFSGPARQGDRIVIVKASAPAGSYYTSSDYAKSAVAGSPVKLRTLPEPGAYEVRYLAGGDGKTLGRAALTVR